MATEWYLAKKEELTEIATAIRNLNGGNAGLKLNDMKNAINTEKSNLEAVKTALKGKGVTVADGAVLSDLSGLIDGIETGGGSSWTDSYKTFVTGEFTPTSNITGTYKIDTGVPFYKGGESYYGGKLFLLFENPSNPFVESGTFVMLARALSNSYLPIANERHIDSIIAINGDSGISFARNVITEPPKAGSSIWTMNLSLARKFCAGKTYRWIYLEVNKT